ncbi:hypothetical protein SAMN04487925_110248 [Bradyrhizobium sp. cf659]|nr:hypothetical protein SAMN04487925_110248 [Bradyrhizobium sp. cf659]
MMLVSVRSIAKEKIALICYPLPNIMPIMLSELLRCSLQRLFFESWLTEVHLAIPLEIKLDLNIGALLHDLPGTIKCQVRLSRNINLAFKTKLPEVTNKLA